MRLAVQRIKQAVPTTAETPATGRFGATWPARVRRGIAVWHGRRKKALTCAVRTEDSGVVVVRVENTGRSTITSDDYLVPLRLRFSGRAVVRVHVAESRPEWLRKRVPSDLGFLVGPDRIILPSLTLAPRDSFTLETTLSGMEPGADDMVDIEGRLADGWIGVATHWSANSVPQ